MKRALRLLALLSWCCLAFAPTSAWSVQDTFSLVLGSNSYSWIDNASPTVTNAVSGNHFEELAPSGFPVSNSILDPASSFGSNIYWFNSSAGGGIDALFAISNQVAQQLYTGTEAAPTFKLGTFTLVNQAGGQVGTLTISAIPEPETYAMLLAGLGLLGWVGRRRKQRAA